MARLEWLWFDERDMMLELDALDDGSSTATSKDFLINPAAIASIEPHADNAGVRIHLIGRDQPIDVIADFKSLVTRFIGLGG